MQPLVYLYFTGELHVCLFVYVLCRHVRVFDEPGCVFAV